MNTLDDRLKVYLEGATAFNDQRSIRDNPYKPSDPMMEMWDKGFEQRRDQVRAARKAAAAAE